MKILDCTIRDGGYVNHNNWDPATLQKIVTGLSTAGIKYIEIGNAQGLGSYRVRGHPLSDSDFMRICMPCKGESLLGMFYAPGYGCTLDDLTWFKDNGGNFVRVGINSTEVEKTFDSISYAKSLGFSVSCNLMKTYAISRYHLVKTVEGAVNAGADCIYLVDSAGGMLPDQVAGYVEAIKEFYDIKVGFHGHNNLLLANANSLAALQAGADMVDATLRGLGRGAGNAQLESMIAICQKARIMPQGCNALQLAELAEHVVGNLLLKGSTKREINVGMVNFHDSYTGVLEKVSSEYGVDPDILMGEVCKINIVNPSEELFELTARQLKEGKKFEFVPAYSHKVI